MKITILALVFVLCANRLQASLGETETELVGRYGKPLGSFTSESNKFRNVEFEYKDYQVSVTILDGVSGREKFTRKDKKPMNLAEMQMLLDANALGSKWEKKDDNASAIIWVLESRQGFAGYYKDPKLACLIIKTLDMLTFEQALFQVQQQQSRAPQKTPDPALRP